MRGKTHSQIDHNRRRRTRPRAIKSVTVTDADVRGALSKQVTPASSRPRGPTGSAAIMPLWYVVVEKWLSRRILANSTKANTPELDPRVSFMVEPGRSRPELKAVVIYGGAVIEPGRETASTVDCRRRCQARPLEAARRHVAETPTTTIGSPGGGSIPTSELNSTIGTSG